MHPLVTRSKLIDLIPEVIRFGPSQFMPEFLQAIQLGLAFLNRFHLQITKPLDEWNNAILFLIVDKLSSSQPTPLC